MGVEENRALVRRFVEALNRRNHAALDGLLARDIVRHCQATPGISVRSLEEFKQFDLASLATFPDQQIVIERLVADDDDGVACWCRYKGTQQGPMGPYAASGKAMDIDFAGFFRVAHGRLAEMWVSWDNVAMLQQLGHFPSD